MADNKKTHLDEKAKKIKMAEELLDSSDDEAFNRELLRQKGFSVEDDNALMQYADPCHVERILEAVEILSGITPDEI